MRRTSEHSLEVAWKAAQNGKRAYFSDDPANPNKAENQRKWLLATVLGALCHDCGKVLSDVVVRDAALTGDKYPAFTGTSLAEWLEGKGADDITCTGRVTERSTRTNWFICTET